MGDCNKFYKTYSWNNLTGGILVLWGTHSICLGFHSISIAEGRNNVFSAICTHFPYFSNTQFLIDEMHAYNHTHCGQTCFASNAMRFDKWIRAVNTSTADFMSYEHATVYTKAFLDIWNWIASRRMNNM
ncbi:hypothetical protein BKA93DRAFT_817800 [Sparassis latifolia]